MVKKGSKKGPKKGSKRVFLGVFGVILERPIFRDLRRREVFRPYPQKGVKKRSKRGKKGHFGPFLRAHISEKAWFTLWLGQKGVPKVASAGSGAPR